MFTGTKARCIRTFLLHIVLAWLPACEPKCEYPVWSLKKQQTRLKPANKEKFRQRAQVRRKLKIFVPEMHLQMRAFFFISKRNWQCNKKYGEERVDVFVAFLFFLSSSSCVDQHSAKSEISRVECNSEKRDTHFCIHRTILHLSRRRSRCE